MRACGPCDRRSRMVRRRAILLARVVHCNPALAPLRFWMSPNPYPAQLDLCLRDIRAALDEAASTMTQDVSGYSRAHVAELQKVFAKLSQVQDDVVSARCSMVPARVQLPLMP